MKLEIERRFLLKSLPTNIDWYRSHGYSGYDNFFLTRFHITQTYYDRNVEGYEGPFRIRREELIDDRKVKQLSFDITRKKLVEKGVFEEEVVQIDYRTYKKIKDNEHDGALKKVRHVIECRENKGLEWEIDVFSQPIHLLIAEIELPSMDYDLKIPYFLKDVIITEVTGQKEFSNRSLAIK